MIANLVSVLLGLVLMTGFTDTRAPTETSVKEDPGVQQVIPPPAWLRNATQQALQLDGVDGSQGVRTGEKTYHMSLRGPRSCDEDKALWQEFRSLLPTVNTLGGFCWQILVPTKDDVTAIGHVLTWTLTTSGMRPTGYLSTIADLARTLPNVKDVEAWSNDAGIVLALYRTLACPDDAADGQMRSDFNDMMKNAGINGNVYAKECYKNQAGPLYNPGVRPAGPRFAHVRQVAEKQTQPGDGTQ